MGQQNEIFGGINALAQLMAGVQRGRAERERRQRQQNTQNLLLQMLQGGNVGARVEPSTGMISSVTPKTMKNTVVPYQDSAAKKGWNLNINESLPMDRQTEIARKLYARKVADEKIQENKETNEYKQNLKAAAVAIQNGKDPEAVYKKMASVYPEKSSELKRILLPYKVKEEQGIAQELEELRQLMNR